MKKRFWFILTITMATCLLACGKNEEAVDNSEPEIQAEEIKDSAEAVDLTQEELDSFTKLFATEEYNGFLVKPFKDASEIEWGEVLYLGAGISAKDVSEDEKNAFYKQIGVADGEECGDLVTLRAEDIKSFVESHTDASYEDIKDKIDFEYVKEYDSYYSLHGDSNWVNYSCQSGKKLNDQYVIQMKNQYLEDDNSNYCDYPDIEVTFVKNGDDYKMISNEWFWEVGNDPNQTFDIKVPGHDNPGRLITYQGNSETGAAAHMIVTVDGKRFDWLGTWYGDADNMSIDFTTIKAVGIFDFTADGADDIVVVAEDANGKEHVGLYEYGVFYDVEGYNYLTDASNWITNYYSEELTIPNVKSYLLGDNQSAEYKTWKDAYAQVVRICNLEGKYKYNLIYLDEDDVPELVVDNEGYYLKLYSFKDGHSVPLANDFGYGAAGVVDYEYAPKKNCIRYSNSDYAGLICFLNYMSVHGSEVSWDYCLNMDNYDDLDGNGYPSEDEMTDEALAKAKGTSTYTAKDESLSQSEIKAKMDELEKYDFEAIHGKYDMVEFNDVMKKF
ncbi:hypothetical protein SAMN02910298_02135 [Pseudobutyrivibrio sp. YE44]|uniref:hypothetical protein n=1 Tax=Pseudobutyrivibrio sp. YE44 TaxID=1520802 RepID=UPI00088895B2|nr:hypothetical protein [Pseudobutyrivibrio sp. YE44]SDB43142.1 hypothetical protein SAMN02910298_02135 [Pseudobutyrivibrio sp. YE44]